MALLDFKKKETNEKMTDSGTVPFNFKFILIQKLIRREVCFFLSIQQNLRPLKRQSLNKNGWKIE